MKKILSVKTPVYLFLTIFFSSLLIQVTQPLISHAADATYATFTDGSSAAGTPGPYYNNNWATWDTLQCEAHIVHDNQWDSGRFFQPIGSSISNANDPHADPQINSELADIYFNKGGSPQTYVYFTSSATSTKSKCENNGVYILLDDHIPFMYGLGGGQAPKAIKIGGTQASPSIVLSSMQDGSKVIDPNTSAALKGPDGTPTAAAPAIALTVDSSSATYINNIFYPGGTITPPPGTGGGTGSGGVTDPCVGNGPSGTEAYIQCIFPRFVDFNTITWLNETYTLLKWGGSSIGGMKYYLTKSNGITHDANNTWTASTTDPGDSSPYPSLQIGTLGNTNNNLHLDLGGTSANDVNGFMQTLINIKSGWNSLSKTSAGDNQATSDDPLFSFHLNFKNKAKSTGSSVDTAAGSMPGVSPTTSNTVIVRDLDNLRIITGYSGTSKAIRFIANNPQAHELTFASTYTQTNPASPTAAADPKTYYAQGSAITGCETTPSKIILSSDPNGLTPSSPPVEALLYEPTGTNCQYQNGPIKVSIISDGIFNASTGDQGASADAGSTAPKATCESEGGVLAWIECAVIRGVSAAIDSLESLIATLLNSDVNQNGAQSILKTAWLQIRDIAYIILIPIMLVMVIGTAVGIGPFDAYTVKKALPRMVIAVMFIALSWYICTFLINLSNVVGIGVKGIIEQPFIAANHNTPITLAGIFGTGVAAFFEGLTVAVGVVILLTFCVPVAMIFLMVTVATLLIRRIFILALLLAAPLAILSWVFPGNNKLWKGWWESFSKLLLVYPAIMALISLGHAFAFIIYNSGIVGGPLSPINFMVTILAYVIGIAFIGEAIKIASGVFATVTGAINNRGKGLFDRAKKGRANKLHRIQNDGLWKNTGDNKGFRRSMNTFAGKAARLNSVRGIDPRKWGAQLGESHVAHAVAASQKLMQDESLARTLGDDNFMYSALNAGSVSEFRKMLADTGRSGASLDRDVETYKRILNDPKYGLDALQLAAFDKTGAGGTMFGYPGKLTSMAAAAHLAQRIGHGDVGLEAYLNGRIRGINMNAGRPDEGALSHGSSMAISESERRQFLMDYDEDTGQYHYLDQAGHREGAAGFTGRVDLRARNADGSLMQAADGSTSTDPELLAEWTARRSFQQSHGSQWMGPSVKDPATRKGINFLKTDVNEAIETGDSRALADSVVKYYEMLEGATTSQKREMLASGFGREEIDLSTLSDAQLAMLGPSIWTAVEGPPNPDGTQPRVLKDKKMTNARMAELARGSREVREVSRQYATDYEQSGRGPTPGDLPPVSGGGMPGAL